MQSLLYQSGETEVIMPLPIIIFNRRYLLLCFNNNLTRCKFGKNTKKTAFLPRNADQDTAKNGESGSIVHRSGPEPAPNHWCSSLLDTIGSVFSPAVSISVPEPNQLNRFNAECNRSNWLQITGDRFGEHKWWEPDRLEPEPNLTKRLLSLFLCDAENWNEEEKMENGFPESIYYLRKFTSTKIRKRVCSTIFVGWNIFSTAASSIAKRGSFSATHWINNLPTDLSVSMSAFYFSHKILSWNNFKISRKVKNDFFQIKNCIWWTFSRQKKQMWLSFFFFFPS